LAVAPRILVVGAGVAGLAAASRLTAAGADVTVLEQAERPGGRLLAGPGSRPGAPRRDGFTHEPGAQVLSSCDRPLRTLLAEAGLEAELLVLRSAGEGLIDGGWIHERHRDGWWARRHLPGVGPIGAARTLRLERLLRRFGANLDPSRPERAAPHDDRSLGDFSRLYFGSALLDAWVGPETVGDCLGDAEDTSRALFLLRSVARRGGHQALFRSGAAGFAALLAEQLDVKSGVEVASVECDGPGGALVRFRDNEIEGTAGADAVVLAVPAFVARDVAHGALVAAERDFYRDVSYLPAISAEILADDPIVPRYLRARTSLRDANPLASLAIEPGGARGRVPDGHAVVRLVARSDWSAEHLDAPDEVVEKTLLAEAVRLFPVLAQRARSVDLSRWRHALPRFEVGRFRALARVRAAMDDRAAAGRRLYFAGDYLGGPSVDGAAASGLRAADALLADLG